MKLPVKSLLLLLLLLGAAFTAALGGFYSATRRRLEDEALLRQMLRAREVAYQLKPGITYSEHLAQSVAAVAGLARDDAELERLVQSLLASTPAAALEGIGIWWEPSAFPGRPPPPPHYARRLRPSQDAEVVVEAPRDRLEDLRQQPWYQRSLEAGGAPVYLEPSRLEDSIYRIHARAIPEPSGGMVGLVAVDVFGEPLEAILREANGSGSSSGSGEEHLYVTTPGGQLFAHPDAARLREWARAKGLKVERLEDLSLADVRRYEAEHGPRRTAQVEIGESGWNVHISSAEDALFASLRRFKLAVLLLGVALWAVLLAVPLLVYRTVRVRELSLVLEERRRVHKVLERSERRLRDVLETALDAVLAVDCWGRVVDWNAQAERTFGWKREEVLGRPASETLLAGDSAGDAGVGPELRSLLERREEAPLRRRVDSVARRQDGELFPVELSATSVSSGEAPVHYVFVSDVTERHRAEEERSRLLGQLQQRGAQLRAIIDTMVDSVMVSDLEGRITFVNKAGRQFFGDEGADGVRLSDALIARQGLRTGSGRPLRLEDIPLHRALRGNVVVDADLSIPAPESRRTLYLRTNAAPIRDEHGLITGAVAVARDVTEMVELDHLKDEFVRVAAHELKTPVAIMKSYAQLALKTEPTPATYRKMLDAINRGADRIDHIVRELLDVSQLHLGQLELTEEPVDLRELAEETVANMAPLSARHRFSVRAGAPVQVRGDRARLRQVLVVLLDNAVRYSPSGGRVEVRLEPHAHEVEVCVSDEGIGIPLERQARLFERFYRAHSGTPNDRGGMGVGLYISREIIFHHGGSMRVSSEEGKGSTFCFSVPYTPHREKPEERS